MSLTKVKTLYAYEDGDTITPRMGVQIAAGHGLTQYYDPATKQVTETDFSSYPAVLFPQAWSSKLASIVVPASGYQWYYNNISDNAGILDSNGNVKSAYSSLFEVTTVTLNNKTFPALRIKGNLVSAQQVDLTDKYIYFVGSYNGKQFTCQQQISVQAAAGNAYAILLSVEGADGSGDETLSADNDWIRYTGYLQLAGHTVLDATITFEHLVNGTWTAVTNVTGVTEISGNSLKIYDAAVEGTELFRAKCVYNSKTYYKTMEPSDIHDARYIDDGCSILGDTVKPGETAVFTPKVYLRETGDDVTTSEGWTFEYVLIKRSDASVITDLTINQLTYDNINAKGGIAVRIIATTNQSI